MALPILKKIESPQQLRELELNHPEWVQTKEFQELWQAFIRRDIPEIAQDDGKMIVPKNPASWHKVYRHLMRKKEAVEKEQEEVLRQQLLGQKAQKDKKKALFVPGVMAHARDEEEFDKFIDGVPKKVFASWSKQPPSLKSAKNGHDAITAIRRQAASNSRQMRIANPLKANARAALQMKQASLQIKQAPESMLRDMEPQKWQEIGVRELLPHELEFLEERKRMKANIKIHAPTRVYNVKHAEAVKDRNAAVVRKAKEMYEAREAKELDEARREALARAENAKAHPQPPEKKWDFEPSPPTSSTEAVSLERVIYDIKHSMSTVNGRSFAKGSSMSPPKHVSPSANPPAAQPTGIRKRPAPSSIFAPKPKKVIKR